MDFRKILKKLDRAEQVSAVYLTGRYLSHGLGRQEFLQKLTRDVKANYSANTVAAVFSIVAAIESQEGAPIASLTMAARIDYSSQLSAIIWEQSEPAEDPERVKRALAELDGH